jgi:hypothetical protein
MKMNMNMKQGGFLGALGAMVGRQALSYLAPKVASYVAGKVMGKKGKKGSGMHTKGMGNMSMMPMGSGMHNKGMRKMGMGGNEGTPMKGMRSHQMGYGMNNMAMRNMGMGMRNMGMGVRPGGALRPLGGALRLLGSKGKRYSGNSIMNRIVQAAKKRGKQELKRSVNYAIDNPKKSYKKVKKLFTGSGYKEARTINVKRQTLPKQKVGINSNQAGGTTSITQSKVFREGHPAIPKTIKRIKNQLYK